jgi:hypothetical protein
MMKQGFLQFFSHKKPTPPASRRGSQQELQVFGDLTVLAVAEILHQPLVP